MTYPKTRKEDVADDYFGTLIPDPYRWLEEDTAPEVEAWVRAQNAVTAAHLEEIPFRKQLYDRYRTLYNYPKVYGLYLAGPYLFFYKNDGLQNQPVLYLQAGRDAAPEVFIDPNTWAKEGTEALTLLSVSPDNRYMVYARSAAGSDWSVIHTVEIATRRELPEKIRWVKFSGASWWKEGFFYTRYPEPEAGKEYSSATEYSSVYYHRIGQDTKQDELVYRDEAHPQRYHHAEATEDGVYLILTVHTGTDGFETYVKDLHAEGWDFQPVFTGFDQKSSIIDHHEGGFLALTDIGAPNRKLIRVDPQRPEPAHWETLIPESQHVIETANPVGGKLFLTYLQDATSRIYQFDYQGNREHELPLPSLGTAWISAGRKRNAELFFGFTSFVYPGSIYRYEIASKASQPYHQTEVAFDPEAFESHQVFFHSKDGTRVPMFLVHKKGIQQNGKNPTLMYGYGGFNISLTPVFSPSRLLLLERGGIFAMVNLRGGGEYGEAWHRAGMLMQKQNVFDDFIAAAEYLVKKGYTHPEKLAMAGGSNGGLLVGAVANQRPDLFKVALPAVGVMDMLRYHKFTVGWGWVPEYGNSEADEATFRNLLSYSPLHNIREGVNYPATLVSTADHDDRVVPAHSFKYIATLQEKHRGSNPVLIRIETNAGHGAGKPTEKIIEEIADTYAFLLYHLGVEG